MRPILPRPSASTGRRRTWTAPDIRHENFEVLPPDPHGFDEDGNGIGCEK